ncbi:MAG: patatin-like phospholipase family protein [Actinomycetota bacterium]|nr:patatin-like phospholipase family protein [Actinomycetota bacterium]
MNAFVLSGGGNLGSIQVGMLKALVESGITPDVLVGTSIGSVNAAFLAADPSPGHVEELCELWRAVRSRDVFTWNPLRMAHAALRRGSLFPPEGWRRFLTERIPYERIEDAAVPLRIMVTDFEDGSPVILESGPVIDAVVASTCLPGIFPPQQIGDHLYLDGVLADQVPLKPAMDAGADTVYVLAPSLASPSPDVRSPGQILRHALTILLFPRIRLDALGLPDRHPKLKIVQIPSVGAQVALWDMSRHDELIETAYQETKEFLAESADADGDGGGHDVAAVPEMTVEVDVRDTAAAETRSAAT